MHSRPLSPHLQVYKLPLAAVVSITHRSIGVVFFTAGVAVSLYCLLEMIGVDLGWMDILLFSVFAKITLSFLATAICFYMLSELRYIVWSFNWGINSVFIKASNILILSTTLLVGVFSFFVMWR